MSDTSEGALLRLLFTPLPRSHFVQLDRCRKSPSPPRSFVQDFAGYHLRRSAPDSITPEATRGTRWPFSSIYNIALPRNRLLARVSRSRHLPR